MRTVDIAERRARLAVRHHVAPAARTDDVTRITEDLLGLHATDPASVYLSAVARMASPDIDAIDDALYDTRSVVRILGMRRTMFVVPTAFAHVVQEGCTRAIAARERRRTVKFLNESHIAGITDDCAAWLDGVERATLAALVARGEALPGELSEDVPELRERIEVGKNTRWPAKLSVSSRVLLLLAADGRIMRGRPRGSWISTQYRWAPIETWLGSDLPTPPGEQARVRLARAWLRAFGPAAAADLTWWTGWTKTQTSKALAEIAPVEVNLGGTTGLLLDDDLAPVDTPEPWAVLLPTLDPTTMGWIDRAWYLGEHRAALFDHNGNAGPTIWWDGRIVGGWAQRADGEIVTRLLEDVGSDAATVIAAEAERLARWLGDRRFVPKFRTPLERELTV